MYTIIYIYVCVYCICTCIYAYLQTLHISTSMCVCLSIKMEHGCDWYIDICREMYDDVCIFSKCTWSSLGLCVAFCSGVFPLFKGPFMPQPARAFQNHQEAPGHWDLCLQFPAPLAPSWSMLKPLGPENLFVERRGVRETLRKDNG